MIKLPDVTLVIVDSVDRNRAMKAVDYSKRGVQFGAECLLFDLHINSIERYSQFMLRELGTYIYTPFALVIQYDGYVVNPAAWEPEFLNYDYIGAPWWYDSAQNVGNGGFSLRSKRLLTATMDHNIVPFHPEDVAINKCRSYMEIKHGVKFAPEDVASRFSWEGNSKFPEYRGSFGFHGKSNISRWND